MNQRTTSDAYWQAFHVPGVAAVRFDSLHELAKESELSLVGRLEQTSPSRQWVAAAEWGEDGIATYVMAHIAVEELVSGVPSSLADGTVGLEMFLPRAGALNEVLRSRVPTERVLFFLRNQREVPGAYMLASHQGYFRDWERVVAPAPDEGHDPWVNALAQMSFDALVSATRTIVAADE